MLWARVGGPLLAALAIAAAACGPAAAASGDLRIDVLSNRADAISGGDALVQVVRPADASGESYTVRVGDRDETEIGEAVGLKSTRPGQSIGTEVQGGETHHLTKGDVIVVPAGTPHWFEKVPAAFTYYVVKVR